MKSSTIIFLLLIIGGLLYLFHINYLALDDIGSLRDHIPLSLLSPEYGQLKGYLDDNSMEIIDFEKSNPLLVRFSTKNFLDMPDKAYLVAKKTFEIYHLPVYVEGFYGNEPVLRIISSDPGDDSTVILEDIRRPEFIIENNLGLFDFLVDSLEMADNYIIVRAEYSGDKEDFLNDYLAASFMIVQEAPGIKKITIEYYVPGDGCLSLGTTSSAVLSAYSDDDVTDFLDGLKVAECGEPLGANERNSLSDEENKGSCPSGDELNKLYDESHDRLQKLMREGHGDTPEAQEAYKEMKFYKDCMV